MVVVNYEDKDSDIIHLNDDFSKELENKVKLGITKKIITPVSALLAQFIKVLIINKGYKVNYKLKTLLNNTN